MQCTFYWYHGILSQDEDIPDIAVEGAILMLYPGKRRMEFAIELHSTFLKGSKGHGAGKAFKTTLRPREANQASSSFSPGQTKVSFTKT